MEWQMETRTKTCGPIPGSLILTHTLWPTDSTATPLVCPRAGLASQITGGAPKTCLTQNNWHQLLPSWLFGLVVWVVKRWETPFTIYKNQEFPSKSKPPNSIHQARDAKKKKIKKKNQDPSPKENPILPLQQAVQTHKPPIQTTNYGLPELVSVPPRRPSLLQHLPWQVAA